MYNHSENLALASGFPMAALGMRWQSCLCRSGLQRRQQIRNMGILRSWFWAHRDTLSCAACRRSCTWLLFIPRELQLSFWIMWKMHVFVCNRSYSTTEDEEVRKQEITRSWICFFKEQLSILLGARLLYINVCMYWMHSCQSSGFKTEINCLE